MFKDDEVRSAMPQLNEMSGARTHAHTRTHMHMWIRGTMMATATRRQFNNKPHSLHHKLRQVSPVEVATC